MRASSNLLAALAAAAGLTAFGAPAHAVVVAMTPGPNSLPAHPAAVIPKGTYAQGTDTYDFTFSTLGGTYSTLMQMQASRTADGAPQALAFELFSGTPGSGSALAPSAGTATTATLLQTLTPGDYYLELTTAGAPKELVTGGIRLGVGAGSHSVPEPAGWALMLVGVGALGARLRRRARPLPLAG
jgi:hypothetical protein